MLCSSPNSIYFICLLIIIFKLIQCDLPVDCRADQIAGHWQFYINKETFVPSLKDERTTCTHGFPDRVETEIGDNDYSFEDYNVISLQLGNDYKVYDNDRIENGHWTPIYNEGMLIYFGDSVFTFFMKYFKKSVNDVEYTSNCSKTMIGWYIPNTLTKDKDWSCAFGKKKLGAFLKNTSFIQINNNNKFQTIAPENNIAVSEKYHENHKFVDEVNQGDYTWDGHIYDDFKEHSFLSLRKKLGLKTAGKEQIYHPSYNSLHIGVSLFQSTVANTRIKLDTSKQDPDSEFVTDFKEISKYINTDLDDIDINTLPKNWDWRNVGGQSYVGDLRVQGNCGSCFTFGLISTLESRLRVKTNNQDKTKFSQQFSISCCFYTEGCDGGFPILVSKFFSEFEVIPEDCFKYTQSTGNCKNVCDFTKYPKKYFVTKYGYLGGYYGATSEELMMKELRARGVIIGNIRIPNSFFYYKEGIFSEHGLPAKNTGYVSRSSLHSNYQNYALVEHTIAVVGYGEEDGIKYWICMNTWGDSWGEKGFFRILRGENECNIETMTDYAYIDYVDRKK